MHGHAGTGGLIVAKKLSVHFVHASEVGEVGKEDGGLHHVVGGKASFSKHVTDVLEGLGGLSLGTTLNKLAHGRIDAELAGEEDDVTDFDALGVRAESGRGLSASNDFLFHNDLTVGGHSVTCRMSTIYIRALFLSRLPLFRTSPHNRQIGGNTNLILL